MCSVDVYRRRYSEEPTGTPQLPPSLLPSDRTPLYFKAVIYWVRLVDEVKTSSSYTLLRTRTPAEEVPRNTSCNWCDLGHVSRDVTCDNSCMIYDRTRSTTLISVRLSPGRESFESQLAPSCLLFRFQDRYGPAGHVLFPTLPSWTTRFEVFL